MLHLAGQLLSVGGQEAPQVAREDMELLEVSTFSLIAVDLAHHREEVRRGALGNLRVHGISAPVTAGCRSLS
jgi:hypothetical protein